VSPIKRSHTVGWGLVAAALLLLGVFTVSKLYSNGLADSATNSAVDLGQQVQQACAAKTLSGPLCQKADDVVRDPAPSPLTAVGAAGQDGSRGPSGVDGKNGLTAPCYYTVTQCVGPKGDTGPGGPAGPPGKDSTVPGPAGPPGETVQGPKGDTGDKGDKGDAGDKGESVQGPPGATGSQGPAPGGLTIMVLGVPQECTYDQVQPDPGHPHYTCG
jgi:hypothetical protein